MLKHFIKLLITLLEVWRYSHDRGIHTLIQQRPQRVGRTASSAFFSYPTLHRTPAGNGNGFGERVKSAFAVDSILPPVSYHSDTTEFKINE